ncbi:tRNA ligase [Piedraia hortae CBS 480.64]|uniref:tRNA ligase n=1 Tax=Piedraia hortae CBS 480.64 TaxID=1314780 RepID=A0A6A7C743_9PEZI|nr:tRNA ligase [Piedraia hortae CBS 480.64]
MTTLSKAPFRPQDHAAAAQVVKSLEQHKGNKSGKGGFSCKKVTYDIPDAGVSVDSWKLNDWDYKKPNLPTYARGLFTTKNSKGQWEIVVRGYNKFFNVGEVNETQWRNVENNTKGPYELSVKENGCIIFLSGMESGKLLVCSKHSTGPRKGSDANHSTAGEKWAEKHLASVGKTKEQLAAKLRELNVTAVAELCDDEFEEHVLKYTPEQSGLYLHGLNLNAPEFVTYPHDLLDRFAEEWGFRKTSYLVKDDIRDVQAFLETVGEQGGHYNGRDTEGFVIRCHSKAGSGEWHNWFFKYKFEEPYLMYRQWRECTKSMVSGKKPNIKKHEKVTKEYLEFAREAFRRNPSLQKRYMSNHGIIELRDAFLASRGQRGHDIIAEEEKSEEPVTGNVVLVPVATIGCGKTTLAVALCKLFGWGHVQNDNITGKKKPAALTKACVEQLSSCPAVVADRNNHQRRERRQLVDDTSVICPSARYVCLHYTHERSNYDQVREVTRARVLGRGDNHQTIHAASDKKKVEVIMEGFLKRFESVDGGTSPDDRFDLIINLDPCADSAENVQTAVEELYKAFPKLFKRAKPSKEDINSAVEAAINDYRVEIRHTIGDSKRDKTRGGDKAAKANKPKAPKKKKAQFFAAQLPVGRIRSALAAVFRDASPEQVELYNHLLKEDRIQPAFHVTLIHSADSKANADYWKHLNDLAEADGLGTVKVRLDRLVWDDRVMAFTAIIQDSELYSVNQPPHITVGTIEGVKPVESNRMLQRWQEESVGHDIVIKGNVAFECPVEAVYR